MVDQRKFPLASGLIAVATEQLDVGREHSLYVSNYIYGDGADFNVTHGRFDVDISVLTK